MARYNNYRNKKRRRNYNKNVKNQTFKKDTINDTLAFSQQYLKEQISNNKLYDEGVAIKSIVNRRTSSSFLQDVKDYSDTNLDDRTNVVELARKLRSVEGICSTVVDLLLDFGITDGRFFSDNKELELVLNKWKNVVNTSGGEILKESILPVPGLREASRKIADAYFTDGDAIFSLYWKQGFKLSNDDKGWFLPQSIKVIDSLLVSIDEDIARLGVERIEVELSREVKEKIISPETPADKYLRNNIPKEWIKFLNNDEPIVLDPNNTFHIKRNPKDYSAWGEPLLLKAFTAIANKRRYQAADEATIDGLINRFTIFLLGLEDREKNPAYHIPKQNRVQTLISILTDPTRANALVWPGPDLKVIDIGPKDKLMDFTDNLKQADLDILRALHVSPLLIDGGSSGQTARDWAAFLSTEVGLDYVRYAIEQIFNQIAEDVAIANNMKYEELYFQFETQMLKDQKVVRNFALKMYELGGISIETFVNKMGYDYQTEKRRKEQEISDGLEEIFINRTLPYQGQSTNQENGRPGNNNPDGENPTDNQDPNREQAQASFINKSAEFYYKIYESAFDKVIEEIDNERQVVDTFDMIALSLVASFVIFRNLTQLQLREAFLKGLNSGVNGEPEYKFLLKWNDMAINRFLRTMSNELEAVFGDHASFTSTLNGQKSRLRLYANETIRKADLLSFVANQRSQGNSRARWITTIDERTCPICFGNHEKIFSLNELLEIFPSHPNCRCDLKEVKDNG